MTEELRIGSGAAVSPFCGVHQTIRSQLGSKRIKIGGKNLSITQLGCKSAGGAKGISTERCAALGVQPDTVARVLDSNMCCYCVKIGD
jgi:hypothetical protein